MRGQYTAADSRGVSAEAAECAERYDRLRPTRVLGALGGTMDCCMCGSGRGTHELARCDEDDAVAMVCTPCARGNADELLAAERRFEEEHVCIGPPLHVFFARRSMKTALADLHVARVHLEQGGRAELALRLSERLRHLEELYGVVKAGGVT
jgi:hypothetical protein